MLVSGVVWGNFEIGHEKATFILKDGFYILGSDHITLCFTLISNIIHEKSMPLNLFMYIWKQNLTIILIFNMKAFLFIINIVAFIGVLLWFIFEPSWESGSSCGIAFAALISQFFWNDSVKKIIKKENSILKVDNSIKDNSSNKVKQKNNTVTNGDIAGRDINK